VESDKVKLKEAEGRMVEREEVEILVTGHKFKRAIV
jgi:hypothetical protein